MSGRREFSRSQKVAMLKRAMDERGCIRCEGCGLNVSGKVVEFDHVIPEALILDKTRELSIEDGRLLGRDCCHRAPGAKTARDPPQSPKPNDARPAISGSGGSPRARSHDHRRK